MIKYVIAVALAAASVAAQAQSFAMKNENGVSWICAGSKTPIPSVQANGAVCRFQLPAGRYRVERAYHDARRGAAVQVRAGSRQPARVVLSFPE